MSKNFLLTLFSVLVLVSSSRAESLRGAKQRNLGAGPVLSWWRNTYIETYETISGFFGEDDEPEIPGFSDEPVGFAEPAATEAPTVVVTTATTFESSFAGTSDE